MKQILIFLTLSLFLTSCSDWGEIGRLNMSGRDWEAHRIKSFNENLLLLKHENGLECAILYHDGSAVQIDGLSCNWGKYNDDQRDQEIEQAVGDTIDQAAGKLKSWLNTSK